MPLKLNPSKFNFIYLSMSKSLPPIMISDFTIYPSSTILSLGFLLDSSLSFKPQILTVASCFYYLRRIRKSSSYLDGASLKIFFCSFVFFRLDYCNSLYYNFSKSTFYSFTEAFNSAARLITHTPKFSFDDFHWLPFHFRSSFKIYFLMHKIFHSTSSSYLSNLLLPPKRAGPRSATHSQLFIISLSHSCAKTDFFFWFIFLELSSSYPFFLKNLKTFFLSSS